MSRRGFTIFELLAVLTIIGITLAVTLGAYNSWATVHALDGAVRTVEAGLLHARSLAKAKNTHVMFSYYTPYDDATNTLKQITSYQIHVFTPTNEVSNPNESVNAGDDLPFTVVAEQRLARAVSLSGWEGVSGTVAQYGYLFFCPDGSLLPKEEEGLQPSPHYIAISTRKRFTVTENQAESLSRIIRIDYATGLPAIIRLNPQTGESQNGNP